MSERPQAKYEVGQIVKVETEGRIIKRCWVQATPVSGYWEYDLKMSAKTLREVDECLLRGYNEERPTVGCMDVIVENARTR